MKKNAFLVLLLIVSCRVFSDGSPLTFVVWSDSHFGAYDGTDTTRLDIMEQINTLGTVAPPAGFAGEQGFVPEFLIHCGDITEHGKQTQWNDPNAGDQQSYLRTLSHLDQRIKPYAALGNHDCRKSSNIRESFIGMYGASYYSFDHKGVHFVMLDPYPELNSAAPFLDAAQLAWLKTDLEKLAPKTPIIITIHIIPTFEEARDRSSRLEQENTEAFAKIISGKNILAIFHGHGHMQLFRDWNGIAVMAPAGFAYYRKGCKFGDPTLGVVQITDSAFTVYSYNWESRSYDDKPLYRKEFATKQ